jgi:hypothetical protein
MEDVGVLLDCDAVQACTYTPTLWRSILSPSLELKMETLIECHQFVMAQVQKGAGLAQSV